MDITIKIHQGTGRQTGENLCKSCRYSHCWDDSKGEHVTCNQMGIGVFPMGPVMNCSRYYNANMPSLLDLYNTAWTLRTEKGGRNIGFTPPDKKNVSDYPTPAY